TLQLQPGDVVSVQTPGGGGCAPVWQRPPALVAADVATGKISVERARQVYGVVVHPDTYAVDEATTAAHRAGDQTASRRMMDGTEEVPTYVSTAARLFSALTQLRRSWVGLIGLGILLFWVLVALCAPWLAPFPPTATLLPFAPPGTRFAGGGVFLLGTD